jgi:CheY-like chemotaxis protein
VSPPTRRGFGSEIIEHYGAGQMGGTAGIRFDREGVYMFVVAPMAEVAIQAPPAADRKPPAEVAAPVGGVPPAGTSAPLSAPLRVLVVEDSALIAMDLEAILRDAGHTVIGPASSVAEALLLAASDHVDVALLDIDLDGQLVTPVAETLRARGIPFAFSTGFERGGAALAAFDGIPVLRKPFDGHSILSMLAALASSRASR